MAYAEKQLISRRDEASPMHTHVLKGEDIVCRGVDAPGAARAVQLHGSDAEGGFDAVAGGEVLLDGVPRRFEAGEVLRLAPGESVTPMPGDCHAFRDEGGDVLIGGVSTVDDGTDDLFRDPIGRVAEGEEDEPPRRLLVSGYAARLQGARDDPFTAEGARDADREAHVPRP